MKFPTFLKTALVLAFLLPSVSCSTAGRFAHQSGCCSRTLVKQAKSWKGKHYRHGSTRQCANWVTHVVSKAGGTPPAGSSASRSWVNWGRSVPKSQIRPGDVLVFSGTYRRGISHVGIALNGKEFIHRSTFDSPVKVSSLERYKIASIRRG